MTEYNKICEGIFTSTGVSKFISLPALPYSFELWNVTAMGTPTQNEITHGISWRDATAGTASVEYFNATPVLTTTNLASGGMSFIEAGTYQYGPAIALAGTEIDRTTGIVTTATAHGYSVGDTVLLYGTTGMLQIAGTLTTITAVGSTTTFTIGNIPTSTFAADATAGFVKKVLYPDLYVPFNCPITGVTIAANSTTIDTAVSHGFVLGQEVFFTFPQTSFSGVWGITGLDGLAYQAATGLPRQAYVTSITDANTFVINIGSNQGVSGTFAYPTSAQASLGITFPQVMAVGDQNTGYFGVYPLPVQPTQQTYTNTLYPKAITIPGAFLPNTRSGVLIGLGNGTQILHATSDVVRWRAIYPDQIQTV